LFFRAFGFFLVSLLIEYRDRGANGAVAAGQMGASWGVWPGNRMLGHVCRRAPRAAHIYSLNIEMPAHAAARGRCDLSRPSHPRPLSLSILSSLALVDAADVEQSAAQVLDACRFPYGARARSPPTHDDDGDDDDDDDDDTTAPAQAMWIARCPELHHRRRRRWTVYRYRLPTYIAYRLPMSISR